MFPNQDTLNNHIDYTNVKYNNIHIVFLSFYLDYNLMFFFFNIFKYITYILT